MLPSTLPHSYPFHYKNGVVQTWSEYTSIAESYFGTEAWFVISALGRNRAIQEVIYPGTHEFPREWTRMFFNFSPGTNEQIVPADMLLYFA
ncbi:hypothetical protein SPFM12_00299 [Salmonella phage SPFM12]|nr:hypothetical protein SPFM12_00299 [Salmonella phage SPFM12]